MKTSRTVELLLTLALAVAPVAAQDKAIQAPVFHEVIRQAGNTESEQDRYRILRELRKREDLPVDLQRDLDTLLPVIDWWANGREKAGAIRFTGRAAEDGYLCHFFYPQAGLGRNGKGKYPPEVSKDSPVYPLWAYYKARCVLWIPIQKGVLLRIPEQRELYCAQARRFLKIAGEAFPENRIIAMYCGKPLPWPAPFEADPNAPDWANLQREGIEKLADMIHWWIDNRQLADGRFGGGWGDDVEMWRWWTPILVGFQDPKITEAQSRLSRGILRQPHLKNGYTSTMSDVEHSNEDTTDSITPMMFLDPDNREWSDRALRIVEHARKTWMGENQRGFLQFKSSWFNVDRVDLTTNRACDTVYHPTVFHPALIHWLRSGDRTVGNLITRWMDTWVDAAAREENGKPAGIVPSAIHWPDGEVGGGVQPWWKPQNYPTDMYYWPSAMSLMNQTLLLTFHMTGEKKYLEPIRSMAKVRLQYLKTPPKETPEPGSTAWCATSGRAGSRGMAGFLPDTLAKYRLLTGDTQFDELLKIDGDGYIQMRLGADRKALVADLERNAKAFRINKPGYTSEMRWTDRVLTFNDRWGNQGNGWNWPTPNVEILYSSFTGDPGLPLYFPMNRVRWLIEPRAFAALVTDSGPQRFTAELYQFSEQARPIAAELYLLEKGTYDLALSDDRGKELKREPITVTGPRTHVTFTLPGRTLCHLRVWRDR